MLHGTISRLNIARGFGFLTTSTGEELFFHRSNMVEIPFSQVQVGDRVSYELQQTPRGPRAGSVKLNIPAAQLQVNLAIHDLDRAVQFYAQALGFKSVTINPAFALIYRGNVVLGLKTDDLLWHPAIRSGAGDDVPRGAGVELVLEVTDIDAFHAQVQQAGLVIQEPLTEQPWGSKDFRLLDPEGYYWRITSPRRVLSQLPSEATSGDGDGDNDAEMSHRLVDFEG